MPNDGARTRRRALGPATEPEQHPSPPPTREQHLGALAEGLTQARVAAGLSQRDLARRMGVSNSTVAALEAGRDPRWSTLRKLLDHLPRVQQGQILPAGSPAPPESSPAAWSAYRDLFGYEAECVSSRLVLDEAGNRTALVEIGPIRSMRGDLADDSVRTALMRAVCLASRPVLLSLTALPRDLLGGMRTIEDGDAVHEFAFDKHAREFTYRRRMTLAARGGTNDSGSAVVPEGSAHDVVFPVRTLQIDVRLPRRSWPLTGMGRAWLPAGTGEPQDSELARYLHPLGLDVDVEEDELRLRMSVSKPLVGVSYALTWQPAIREPRDRHVSIAPRKPRSNIGSAEDVGRTLREARSRSRESLRQTARRLGVSWVTVREAERGTPARATTLMAYLAAFPSLCSQDLLPGLTREEPLPAALLWEYYRQLFGFWAEDLTKTVRIEPDGHCRTTIATKALRALRPEGDALKLRLGLQRAVLSKQASLLESLSESGKGVRVQRVDQRGGRDVHQFTLPQDGLLAGIDYTRRFARRRVFHMHELTARREMGGPPPYVEGTSVTVMHPVRRLRLSVQFPRGYRPAEVVFHAWPDVHVPDPLAAEPNCLSEFEHSIALDRSSGAASLTVQLPLVGFKHAVSWRLP